VFVCSLVCMCGCECVENVHISGHLCCLCLECVFVDVCFLIAYSTCVFSSNRNVLCMS
jgi:hypothetical protein